MSLTMNILSDIWHIGIGIFTLCLFGKYFLKAAEFNHFTTLLCSIILLLLGLHTLYEAPMVKNYVDKPSNTCASQQEAKQNDTNKA